VPAEPEQDIPTEPAQPEASVPEPERERSESESAETESFKEDSVETEQKPLPEPPAKEEDEFIPLAESSSTKVKHPISVKLIAIISLIVVFALGLITSLVSYYVTNDVRISAEENNMEINSRSAADVENRLENIHAIVDLLLSIVRTPGSSEQQTAQAANAFFDHNADIAAVYIPGTLALENRTFFLSHEITPEMTQNMFTAEQAAVTHASGGAVEAVNVSPYFNTALLALMYPDEVPETGKQSALIILYSTESISDTFGTGTINSSFMVNSEGYVLAHPDSALVLSAADMNTIPIVKQMRTGTEENRQMLYSDEKGAQFFGAYRKLKTAGIGVITIVPAAVIFESVRATTRRNIYLTAAVLALSILISWFFAKTIITPIKALAAAAHEIAQGHFELHMKPRTKDELGLLTRSFVDMGKGLAERERLKDTFGRFSNKEIAERAMKGELTLGGESKDVTIFFSDIRSFTALSEKLQPADVVAFLNDYMTRMVECVNSTNGVVDKFIGDAIMAVWGAPVSSGSPKQDALNAVRTALLMRHALSEFNAIRISHGQTPIRIGCGINSGPVIAGQIGSTQRMEYTCIGDTVNLASRTESLNKPFATDILITENTYTLIQDAITVEPMLPVTVKGKEKPVNMYAVINMPQADDIPGAGKAGPATLAEIRQAAGVAEPDLTGVNLDEEEKKYKIQGK